MIDHRGIIPLHSFCKRNSMKKYLLLLSLSLTYAITLSAQAPLEAPYIKVSDQQQKLFLIKAGKILQEYPVSTSRYGIGSEAGSNKTPQGKHKIIKKIGDEAPVGTIFRSRLNTGKIATIYTDTTDLEQDDVTTRILRLTGLEKGINQGGNVDSFQRYIYIHGTPEEGLIGQPASHGCIRMRNADVVQLFDAVEEGTLVVIEP